jgi:uncharacterized protein (DUF1330 family)
MIVAQSAKFALILIGGLAASAVSGQGLHAQSETKPAYLVVEIEVTDPAAFQAYQQKAMETLKPHDIRVLANTKPDMKEGAPAQGNIIVLRFTSMADAQKWYDSPSYQKLIPERQKAAKARLYLVEGMSQ